MKSFTCIHVCSRVNAREYSRLFTPPFRGREDVNGATPTTPGRGGGESGGNHFPDRASPSVRTSAIQKLTPGGECCKSITFDCLTVLPAIRR